MVQLGVLELLITWGLGSELELSKNECSTRQDVDVVKGFACTLHSVTSAGPTVMGSISCWVVTRSCCRKACEVGDIFAANFGKVNMT